MSKRVYITDKELGQVIECGQSCITHSLHNWIRGGKRRKTAAVRSVNLLDMEPLSVNGMRRWNVVKVAAVLGITEEELLGRIA